jgi:uncharacterized protein YutE (UPF0331/DUF86 family)
MIDPDVVYGKVNRIQNCLKRIYDTVDGDLSKLDAYDVQDVVTLNLQRAAQLVIDLAAHVVRAKSLGMPQSLKDNFQLLYTGKIIDNTLKEKMQRLVGFRNVAVHDYESINPNILKSIVEKHLQDIEEFYAVIVKTCVK